MPKFAANLSMLFTELPFEARFEAAAEAGFAGVECLFPYELGAEQVATSLERHRLTQVLFNLPPGDWEAGERGLAALPGREPAFEAALETAIEFARTIRCPTLHVMAGVYADGFHEVAWDTYVRNLRHAAARAEESGVVVVIEPINDRDIPGYFLNYCRDAARAIELVGSEHLGLQLDLYHCQIMEGDLATHVRDYADITRHVQIAGVPQRHEPNVGEVNYPYLFELLDATGYTGWVGCEYRPRAGTSDGLGWFAPQRTG